MKVNGRGTRQSHVSCQVDHTRIYSVAQLLFTRMFTQEKVKCVRNNLCKRVSSRLTRTPRPSTQGGKQTADLPGKCIRSIHGIPLNSEKKHTTDVSRHCVMQRRPDPEEYTNTTSSTGSPTTHSKQLCGGRSQKLGSGWGAGLRVHLNVVGCGRIYILGVVVTGVKTLKIESLRVQVQNEEKTALEYLRSSRD